MADLMPDFQSSQVNGDEEPLLAFNISLEEVVKDEDNGTFRTQNQSLSDYERRNIIQRTEGNVHTRVDLLEVTHGSYEEGDGEATLLVLRFRFDSQKKTSRVIRALVKIEFAASDPNDEPPVVDAIAPEERWTVLPTIDQESLTIRGELSLGTSTVVGASAKASLSRTATRDVSGATTVSGSINLGSGSNKGDPTVAVWNMLENKHRKTGVPDSVKVAILLRRKTTAPFKASVTLKADCDFATGLQHRFTKFPLDDPILFNPRKTGASVKKGRTYGVESLGAVSLDSLSEVRMAIQAPFVV